MTTKTPQQFRRQNVKNLFDKILKRGKTELIPLSIDISESIEDGLTTVNLSLTEKSYHSVKVKFLKDIKAKGYVDGLFKGLQEEYKESYPTLNRIKLIDLSVIPTIKKTSSVGSDAKTNVSLSVNVDQHGEAEFYHRSRSMVRSSFFAVLKAFEFYINCERTFVNLKNILEDAQSRNRGDIIQTCLLDLSKLTEVNTYEG